jgi:large-conductance mechanosensitive channel
MILIRFLLVSLIVFLIVRSFIRHGEEARHETRVNGPEKKSNIINKKVSKEVGEYVDYEEVDK